MKIRDEINNDMPSKNTMNLAGEKKLTINTVGSTQLIGRKWLKLLTEKQSKKKQPFFGSFEKPRVKISTIHCTYSCTCNFTMTYFLYLDIGYMRTL